MQALIQFVSDHPSAIWALLFAISECLALIPAVSANSIFQLVFGWLKSKQPK